MATSTRCAPEIPRAKTINYRHLGVLLAVVAAMAATGWTSTARAAFDDGAGACSSDWGSSDSSDGPATGTVDFNVDAAGCFGGDQYAGPISLTGGSDPDADCGILLSAGDGGSDNDYGDWGDEGHWTYSGGTYHWTNTGGGQITTDSVKLPEPGSLALLGLAASGLITRRANNKKGLRV